MPHIERSADQMKQIRAIGMYLVEEQGTGIVKKLQTQGVFPPRVQVEVDLAAEREPVYVHPEFTYYRDENRIVRGDLQHTYTRSEGKILDCLSEMPNKVVKHEVLARKIGGDEVVNQGSASGTLKTFMSGVRKGLVSVGVEDPSNIIKTHHSVGYELVDPSHEQDRTPSSFNLETKDLEMEAASKIFHHPLFDFDVDRGVLVIGSDIIPLRKKQIDVLSMLARNTNRIVEGGHFMDIFDEESETDVLKTYISHLRAIIRHGREIGYPIIGSKARVGYTLLDFSRMTPAEAERMKEIYERNNS